MFKKDTFRGRRFDEILEKMPEFFRNILMVMDDVKESIEKSAEFAAKSAVKVWPSFQSSAIFLEVLKKKI